MHPFATLQRLLPQHALSRLLGAFAASRNRRLKRWIIDAFRAIYRVDMSACAGRSAEDFESFNHFFARALAAGARPLPADPLALACPAEGTVSQAGRIVGGELVQAKGRRYPVADLLGDGAFAAGLDGGTFVTVYLAPKDYHRVHAPCAARLTSSLAIPGRLFSVNAVTERHLPRLFARNERLVLRLAAGFGEFALVLVGAMIVASIQVTWPGGPRSPYKRLRLGRPADVAFARGAEVGAFLLGSTVIALFPPSAVALHPSVAAGRAVRVRESIGVLTTPAAGRGGVGGDGDGG